MNDRAEVLRNADFRSAQSGAASVTTSAPGVAIMPKKFACTDQTQPPYFHLDAPACWAQKGRSQSDLRAA